MVNNRPQTVLKRLGSFSPDRRGEALCDLRELSTDQFARHEELFERQHTFLVLLTISSVVAFAFTVLVLVGPWAHVRELVGFLIADVVLLLPYLIVRYQCLHYIQRGLGQARAERVVQVGSQEFLALTETLDALYKALPTRDQNQIPPEQRYDSLLRTHREMLLRELTVISPERASLLSLSQRGTLFYWIGHLSYDFVDPNLGLAALDALMKSGDARVYTHVRVVANVPPATARMRKVRNAAREHLKILDAREYERRQGKTLLRGSARPTGPDTLLRPVRNIPIEMPGDTLLRAAQSEPSSCHKGPNAFNF